MCSRNYHILKHQYSMLQNVELYTTQKIKEMSITSKKDFYNTHVYL